MAHSQAEKPARVCDQWDGTLTDRNNQGGRGDEKTRLAGMMLMGLNQTLSGRLAKGGSSSSSSSSNNIISEYGCEAVTSRLAEMLCWSAVLAQMLGGWNQRVVV